MYETMLYSFLPKHTDLLTAKPEEQHQVQTDGARGLQDPPSGLREFPLQVGRALPGERPCHSDQSGRRASMDYSGAEEATQGELQEKGKRQVRSL